MSIRYLAGLSLEGIVCFEGMQSYKGQKSVLFWMTLRYQLIEKKKPIRFCQSK